MNPTDSLSPGVGYWLYAKSATTVTFPMNIPGTPAGLQATGGDHKVVLTWASASDAATYNVYQGTKAGGEAATPVATGITVPVGASSGTATISNLTVGQQYYFTVAAVNGGGTSPKSSEVQAVPVIAPPTAPTNLTVVHDSPSAGSVTLTWTASTGATAYYVYESGTLVDCVTGTSAVITGLTNGAGYSYAVAGVNSGGVGALSSTVSTALNPSTPDFTLFVSPTTVTAMNGTDGSAVMTLGGSTISIAATGVFNDRVLLSYDTSNLPAGLNIVTSASYAYTGVPVQLGIVVSQTVAPSGPSSPGYLLTVQGTSESGHITHSVPVYIKVPASRYGDNSSPAGDLISQ